jgi:cytoskeletal protein RodZ
MIRVGSRLQNARIKKGFTLEEVAKATKIREEFLDALEKGEYNKLPSSTYVQGFINNYTSFLGLPQKETIAIFKREFDEGEHLGVLPESFTHPHSRSLFSFRLGNYTLVGILTVVFILSFVAYGYRAALWDPYLSINSPKESQTISSQSILVLGKTDINTIVTVNDDPAYVDKDGNFKKEISVFSGNVAVTVKAVNSFGRKSTMLRHVVVK